jgi:hypothetical protein
LLFVTVTVVILGISLSVVAPEYVATKPTPTPSIFDNTSIDDVYDGMLEFARERKPDALLDQLRLIRTIEDGLLAYSFWFSFCSTSDSFWDLDFSVSHNKGLFGVSQRISRYECLDCPAYIFDCSVDSIEYPNIDNIEIIERIHVFGAKGVFEYLEKWPDHMRVEKLENGRLVWRATHDYIEGGFTHFEIYLDAQTGEVIDYQGYDYRLDHEVP